MIIIVSEVHQYHIPGFGFVSNHEQFCGIKFNERVFFYACLGSSLDVDFVITFMEANEAVDFLDFQQNMELIENLSFIGTSNDVWLITMIVTFCI